MGVRGTRRLKELSADNSEKNLMFTSVESLLHIAKQRNLYEDERLNIKELIGLKEDISVEYIPLDPSISGKLSRNSDKWIITVNKNHHVNRQRFTLAHELAHYVLHKSDSDSFTDTVFFRGASVNNIEYAANEFAANLLMPEDKVRQLIRVGVAQNIETLAKTFGVSVAAMLYRIKQLGFRTKE
ncbi:ImmA/IrrE family metallo-endopeptidase [Porphyromonas loveana]|uniref:ImmA/IrrE family metallo-endopeptidase n=1 Tax=Porphyromonas loveana TaxID=1884669 RepID=UPI0035A155AB